jgi:HlyD family secretion protein
MKKWLVLVVILAALAGGGFWYWKHQANDQPDYKTTPVTLGNIVQVVTATGQLNPVTNVTVGSQVSGIISKLYVDFNSPVTNGQLIAQLDPANYKALLAQADGDVANTQAALELAKVNQERAEALYQNKILAKSDYDTAVAALHQAQAMLQIKEASQQQARVNLAYTSIFAPINGTVITRNVDVGQTVAASLSAPTLFIIANDLTRMQIDALVSEADIGGIETNQAVNFLVDAFPSRNFHGTVVQVRNAAQTNQNVITYDTVIMVDNSDLKLKPGMTANVSIVTDQRTNVLKIPNGALRFRPPDATNNDAAMAMAGGGSPQGNPGARGDGNGGGGGRRRGDGAGGPPGGGGGNSGRTRNLRSTRTIYVAATENGSKDITAKPVQIRTGVSDGVFTEVVDGLKEGDEVITGQNITGSTAGASGQPANPFGGGGRRF